MTDLNQLSTLQTYCEDNGVKLIAVSKTKPASDIMEVYRAGHRVFGENRASELAAKHNELPDDIEWHMIGHLQRNKVKEIVGFVHLVHSLDSFRLAKEIDKRAARIPRRVPVLLQIHIAREQSKYGFDMEELKALLDSGEFRKLEALQIRGVMGMATFTDDEAVVREEFRYLKKCFDDLRTAYFADDPEFREISMGMTGDYNTAVEEGSTMVRIGSAIFGPR